MEKETKEYEVSFLATDETGAHAVLEAVKRRGAEIFLEGPVERIALAYKIRRETAAYFGYIHFRVSPDAVRVVSDDVKGQKAILRALVVTPPLMKPKPRWEGAKVQPKSTPAATPPTAELSAKGQLPLSNEALEKQIEEILK